ncbi:LacI family DNA-binding transcriptional regulator [Hydrogenispora ethanolica]|uniref:LacI family DNA-binding transcriptional regulator n=1 Tax=Hydrogenispora ethanolica TaxID=1082276 RepID=UPI0014054AAF|nr:LacI family DNA-binding transcriptional regulator [Hydrogenispora ethanolica]
MATIKDVAQLANVSPSTVSRVIADSKRISDETKERVKAAMQQLHYHPNLIARSLIRRSSQTLGLVLSRSTDSAFSNPFFPEILRGISAVSKSYHYGLMLAAAEDYAEEAKLCLKMMTERRVDGVLLLASRVNDGLIRELSASDCPFVVLGRAPESLKCYSVNNDNIQAAYSAVRHLLNLGHQRIALLNGPADYIFCQDRFEGYRFAFREFGIEHDPEWIKSGSLTQEDGYRLTRELFQLDPAPSAIFCVDDVMAIGAYQAIKERGLTIPGDIAVVGFNDDPLASVIEPHLTTVRIPIYEMGVTATQMIIRILEGNEPLPFQRVLSSELVIRQSCGANP